MTELLPDQVIDEDRFRRALALHAAGVVVVTATSGGAPAGLTATSFSSVSLAPPLVSFYVAHTSTTWPSLRAAQRFAVNILSSGQADLATRFALRGVDRFAAPTRWRPAADGTPLLEGVCAHLLCTPHTTIDIGDHVLVVGRVTGVEVRDPGDPLLYHRGRFGDFHPQTP
ncbi:NADH-FMN oxidoreductase RutF, flavin reductase (DIM6/NTAB) family [Thermomonospora echinospora]|uniref:NADH-FMN oxidoreductase RutF, flavin reductase (DIM6/NTAB) family n=1 Tax=Thermomonospora echinospora TaxID=1992 RepID=A0A1H6B257_9ACTN|nr:flavin reductase family protein [Thermomonospora echinospora]SEG54307.1 NADH-FMN oxidoreductase RutF, flavin reductase (DIM6/NTAB) family [Thermomonospora echinospora]